MKNSFDIRVYKGLNADVRVVRHTVFEIEQGFLREYDDIDDIAEHIVMFDNDSPIAVCRIFPDANSDGGYILGRLAVMKAYRGKGIGAEMIKIAESFIRERGGASVSLHSQLQARKFYERCGYTEYGDIGYEETCPHIWMKKAL